MIEEIVFVYNADSGALNILKDGYQKFTAPEEYECNLCMVTYGNVFMRKEWKDFTSSLSTPVRFLHKDEILKDDSFPKADFPNAYFKKNGEYVLAITAEEMNAAQTISDFKQLTNEVLEKHSE